MLHIKRVPIALMVMLTLGLNASNTLAGEPKRDVDIAVLPDVNVNPKPKPIKSRAEELSEFLEQFPKLPQEVRDQAILELFAGSDPEEVRLLRQLSELMLKAERQLLTPVTPVSDVITLNLNPNAKPYQIRTREGFNTILSFVDSIGNPWPILWAVPGVDAYEEIQNTENTYGASAHIAVLRAKEKYRSTNYTVQLLGLSDPIVFILENDQEGETAFKLTFKVPKIGPNTDYERPLANEYASSGRADSDSKKSSMLQINQDDLDDFWVSPPIEAEVLPTSHPNLLEAYFYKNTMIVKSRFEVAANFSRTSRGPGGWGVFVLSKPEYEIMVVTNEGAVLVSVPVDMVKNLTNRIAQNEGDTNG